LGLSFGAAAAGIKAADDKYANLLLALFVYIKKRAWSVFLGNKHVILERKGQKLLLVNFGDENAVHIGLEDDSGRSVSWRSGQSD